MDIGEKAYNLYEESSRLSEEEKSFLRNFRPFNLDDIYIDLLTALNYDNKSITVNFKCMNGSGVVLVRDYISLTDADKVRLESTIRENQVLKPLIDTLVYKKFEVHYDLFSGKYKVGKIQR